MADSPAAIGVRVSGDDLRSRFVADLTASVSYGVSVLPDPFRVVIDLPKIDFRLPAGIGQQVRGLIAEYRYGSLDDGRSRIVIDTDGPVLIEKTFLVPSQTGQPARLVLDLVKTDRETFLRTHRIEQSGSPASRTLVQTAAFGPSSRGEMEAVPEDVPPLMDSASTKAPQTAVPLPQPKPGSTVELPVPPPAPPPVKRSDKRVIVIDPGHGGIDPGAIGIDQTKEKDIVLAFSRVLREQLLSAGRYDVVMTRDDDRFVTLKERVRVARSAQADLFIAVHADKVRGPTARGATVYTLSEKASDAEAEALAQKENRADIIGGVDLGAESEEITDILIDLAQRETKNHSRYFAKKAVGELKPVTLMTGRPMRSAGFVVLKAPDVPSILLELGYLSSRSDEKLLNSEAWRLKIAKAIGQAVDAYMRTDIAQRQ